MLFKEIIKVFDVLDSPDVNGHTVKKLLESISADANIQVTPIEGKEGSTDFIRIVIPGTKGKISTDNTDGCAPTLGIIGRLGGLGARPARIGFVSDGDGALCALSIAAKLLEMKKRGDELYGDVIISTHICPNAPTMPHDPVPFMGSPVDMKTLNEQEVDSAMDAILCIDTTKGNNVINYRGFAISPTIRQGYILKTSNDLLELMMIVTGKMPQVFPVAQQDITPYGNGLTHINSILQPATATDAPLVGVAITTETAVPGCATGATHFTDIDETCRFALEVAKAFGEHKCEFYSQDEFDLLQKLYGSMDHFSQK